MCINWCLKIHISLEGWDGYECADDEFPCFPVSKGEEVSIAGSLRNRWLAIGCVFWVLGSAYMGVGFCDMRLVNRCSKCKYSTEAFGCGKKEKEKNEFCRCFSQGSKLNELTSLTV